MRVGGSEWRLLVMRGCCLDLHDVKGLAQYVGAGLVALLVMWGQLTPYNDNRQ